MQPSRRLTEPVIPGKHRDRGISDLTDCRRDSFFP
jgi:hypothetical protein